MILFSQWDEGWVDEEKHVVAIWIMRMSCKFGILFKIDENCLWLTMLCMHTQHCKHSFILFKTYD